MMNNLTIRSGVIKVAATKSKSTKKKEPAKKSTKKEKKPNKKSSPSKSKPRAAKKEAKVDIRKTLTFDEVEKIIKSELKAIKKKLPEDIISHQAKIYFMSPDRLEPRQEFSSSLKQFCEIYDESNKPGYVIPVKVIESLINKLGSQKVTKTNLRKILDKINEDYHNNKIDPHESAGIVAAQ